MTAETMNAAHPHDECEERELINRTTMVDIAGAVAVGSEHRSLVCPTCGVPLDQSPYCPRDGTLAQRDRFVLGERYVVHELIGGGGFGFVFGGSHIVLGKPVAIKIVRDLAADSAHAKRFLREARTASQLSHEHIVSIFDFGRDERLDLAFLVMERFAGTSLATLLQDTRPMPVTRAVPILIQLARAMGAAHAADVVHRDINPRNVLIGHGDFVKLCDFGVSRSLVDADRITALGAVVGTPAYMAPEQIRGDAKPDPRADIFGFGCTAYEMLTGRLPHAGPTAVSLLASRLNNGTVEAIIGDEDHQIPAAIEQLVMSCLNRDPLRRPTASEIEARLRAILVEATTARLGDPIQTLVAGMPWFSASAERDVAAIANDGVEHAPQQRLRRRGFGLALGVVALAAAAVLALSTARSHPHPPALPAIAEQCPEPPPSAPVTSPAPAPALPPPPSDAVVPPSNDGRVPPPATTSASNERSVSKPARANLGRTRPSPRSSPPPKPAQPDGVLVDPFSE
ncbi:MAG: serine/threonine-protein kinase [Kofleriaceae bacterium]